MRQVLAHLSQSVERLLDLEEARRIGGRCAGKILDYVLQIRIQRHSFDPCLSDQLRFDIRFEFQLDGHHALSVFGTIMPPSVIV